MTDWDRMKEQIGRAMKSATDQSGDYFPPADVSDILDSTRTELIRLESQLRKLQWALDNPGQYSMDEIFDILSRLISGHSSGYRKSQPVQGARSLEETSVNDSR